MKFTDEAKSVIALGGGVFVPVDPMNRDYHEVVLPRLAKGERIEDADPVPVQVDLAERVAALEAKLPK